VLPRLRSPVGRRGLFGEGVDEDPAEELGGVDLVVDFIGDLIVDLVGGGI
jgi:hypothetical protein